MANIKDLFLITKQLFDHLEKPLPKEEREEYLQHLEQLLNGREQLIENFDARQPQTDEEQKMATLIVQWNKQMNERLTAYLALIKKDINSLKKQKDTGKKYENPYQHAPIDGAFFDKKK